MTNPKLSREYLMGDELKQELVELIERAEARREAERQRRADRRRRLQRLTFGLLGR
jgi:hypothetical protein